MTRFFRLSSADRRLLLESVLLLSAIKLGLWFLPFRMLRSLIARIIGPAADLRQPDRASLKKVAWSMKVVGRRLPIFKNCLNRALATQLLFGRRGQTVDLRFGVSRHGEGKLEAHAWIESCGRIVVGEVDNHSIYVPLAPLEGKSL
jgi:hypothetical protein